MSGSRNRVVYWPPAVRSGSSSPLPPATNEHFQSSNQIYDNLENDSFVCLKKELANATHNFNTRETFTKNIKQLEPDQWPPSSSPSPSPSPSSRLDSNATATGTGLSVPATAEIANKQRIDLTRSPVCRPRKIDRDREYGTFFAKNKINNYYSTYRAPPGTQHYNNPTEFSDL